jgi:hypothetical protein
MRHVYEETMRNAPPRLHDADTGRPVRCWARNGHCTPDCAAFYGSPDQTPEGPVAKAYCSALPGEDESNQYFARIVDAPPAEQDR